MRPPASASRLVLAALVLVAAACGERPLSPEPGAPRFEIRDGSTGGTPGFFFLPPLVANPPQSAGGTFDGSLAPTVVICEWAGSQCGAVVAQFTTTGGTGAEVIRVDAAAQQYVVNWQTDQCTWGGCTLDPAKTYRIRVRVGSAQLGSADVQVFSNAREARNSTTGATVALVNGRTLPLKFRIQQGTVSVVGAGVGAPVGSSGGIVVAAGGALSVSVAAGALPSPVPITAEPLAPASLPPAPGLVPGSAFEMGPDGTQFATPATLAIAYDPATLPAGVQASMLRLHTLESGRWVQVPGSRVDVSTRTVLGEVSHFSTYAVLPRRIRWAGNQPSMGVDQVLGQGVLLPEPMAAAVPFTIENRNTVLTVGEPGTSNYASGGQTQSYVMPAGAVSKTFVLYSERLGADTLVVAAAGYLPDTMVMPVTRGKVILTGWPATLQAGDSARLTLITTYPETGNYAGVAHAKTFTLSAGPNLVLTRDGQPITGVELGAGAFQSAAFYVKVTGGGPAALTVANPDYEPLTATLTAVAPRLRFAAGQRAVGLGQITGQDITIPAAVGVPVNVSLTNRNASLTIGQGGTANYTYGGQTGTYTIPAGDSHVRLVMLANQLGTDTLIAAAPGYLPDTVVIAATLGRLLVTGMPTAPLAAGDSVALSIIQTLPSGTYTSAGYPETYALSAGPNAVLTRNGQVITSMTIQGFQSETFYLKAVSGGGGTLSIGNPHYEPVSAGFSTYQTWELARDFPATNPGGAWSAGWTAGLGAPFTRYPDYLAYYAFASWTQLSIRRFETPDLRKNVTGQTIYTVPPGWAALHPGCNAGESSVARWTAPADATYELSARFLEGDAGNTTAHVLRNGSAAAPLFAAATTNGSPVFTGSVALTAGETLDFVVGVANDNCYGDTTPLAVTVTRR